jgi:hypothetical protein
MGKNIKIYLKNNIQRFIAIKSFFVIFDFIFLAIYIINFFCLKNLNQWKKY